MYTKSLLRPILVIGIIATLFASCDKDYDELGTNIVGDDHFGFEQYTGATVKTYNQGLGPIASNNLTINPLGFYENPAFGKGHADFVTQLEMASVNPTFNNGPDVTEHPNGVAAIDSVILEIPYFINKSITTNTDGTKLYTLDSIYGAKPYDQTTATLNSKFKLSIYQSNYFLRDLDPDQSFGTQQLFYTSQGNDIENFIINTPLNNSNASNENSEFYFDKREHKTTVLNTDNTTKDVRSVPSMRLHLSKDAFTNLILEAPSGQLTDNAVFKNYFRGLYFKTESIGNEGNMAMINFKGGKVTIYYNEDKVTKDNLSTPNVNEYKVERVNKTFVLNLTGNTVSLLKNTNEDSDYLAALSNPSQEASQLYLKGGQGSVAVIDLFGSTDLKGYTRNTDYDSSQPVSNSNPKFLLNPSYNPNLPISDSNSKYLLTGPNGVSDELDEIKVNGWLINEANLTFYINKTKMGDQKTIEPGRVFLYDLNNKRILVDYASDITTNSKYPKYNKYVFGGLLLDEDGKFVKQIKEDGVISNKGTKYKIRITNHIRNLINKDSTNVRLGLSVTEDINKTIFSKRQTPGSDVVISAPSMSVLSPVGTILYGSGPSASESQKLKLEIYYTKPN
jgi:hypothetical protein